LVILSLKEPRKAEASAEGDVLVGKVGGVERDSKESKMDHSFFGWLVKFEMVVLKYSRRAEVMSFATWRDWILKLFRSEGARDRL
jgi:hypothetical protein